MPENIGCPCGSSSQIRCITKLHQHCFSSSHQQAFFPDGHREILSEPDDEPSKRASFLSLGQRCICRVSTPIFQTNRKIQVHLQTSAHILGLYLQSIAWFMNDSDPLALEVLCPFLCYFRYSLYNVHVHDYGSHDSGQYSTIYCNILRFIPDDMLRVKFNISIGKDTMKLMIPFRFLGVPRFSIDDVYDLNGNKKQIDSFLHATFSIGAEP